MTSRLSRLTAAAAAAALVILAPAAAYADDPAGRLDHVETGGSEVKALFSVPGLPVNVSPDPATIEVTFGGEQVDAVAELQTGSSEVKRTSVLTIDVSKSMAGPSFDAAKTAALTYLDSAPEDVYIALVTFASTVETVEAPTQDHAALKAAIVSLALSPETRLFDGVLQSLAVAGRTGERTILLLSDGKDTTATSLATVIDTADKADVRIDAVGLNQELTDTSPLTQIVDSTGGTVTSTSDLDTLQAVFAEEADELAKQMLVTFSPPAGSDGSEDTLVVSVEAEGLRYDDQAFVALPSGDAGTVAAPDYTAAASSVSVNRMWLIGGLGCLFVGLALLFMFGLNRLAPSAPTAMQQQLSLYTVHGIRRTEPAPSLSEGVDLKKTASRLADRLVVRRDLEERIAKKLDAAGLKLKPAEWLLLHAAIFLGAGMAGLLIAGPKPSVILVALLAGAVLPWSYLNFKAKRRLKAFASGLAETLQILAGGLQAGLSLSQAVDTIVKEGSEPIASEFRRAIVEQRLGIEIEDSLETVAARMQSVDFKWVVMAIRIQREVGGNLAELLLTVSATLREREYLRRQVAVLSAEGRLSAWILGGLPPFFVVYLMLTRPTYVAPMFETHLGWLMSSTAVVLMVIGVFWLKKSVKVEV